MPWSRHSQMNAPWSPGWDSIASQYSASVPLLLPMACEYSHRMSGRCCVPDSAWSTIDPMGGYIGQMMSVTFRAADQSKRMAPS